MTGRVESAQQIAAGDVELATCSDAYWRVYMRGHVDGHLAGFARGVEHHREQIEAADAKLWAEATRRVHTTAKQPSYATLCDRRGDPDRAARAREHEQRLAGVS